MDNEMGGGTDTGTDLERAVERLSEPEQRLYALAKQAIPLAEVAVRLGVTIAEADRRVGLLCAALGFSDRVALQAGVPAMTAEAEGDGAAVVSQRKGRTFSRRAVLAAAGAGVAAVAGGGAWAALSRGGPKPAAVVGSTATMKPTPAKSERIERDDTWDQWVSSARLPLPWSTAAYLIKVADGSVEGYRTDPGSAPDVLAAGEVLLSGVPGANTMKLYRRKLARGFRWPGQELSLAAATAEWMLFEELEPRGGGGPGQPTGKFRMVDYDLRELLRFEVAGPVDFPQRVLVSPDGRWAAIWRKMGHGSLVKVNLVSGENETRFDFELRPPLQMSAATPVNPGHE